MRTPTEPCSDEQLSKYRPWLYAAAAYNLAWGGVNILFPSLYFDLVGIEPPNYAGIWQVVGCSYSFTRRRTGGRAVIPRDTGIWS